MSDTLQNRLERSREAVSESIETAFEEVGKLYVEGYSGNSWGCSQNVRSDNISWGFKYSADDENVEFVRGTYNYEQPKFELNTFTYEMERTQIENIERDVYVVSQYGPANVWDMKHVGDELVDGIERFLVDLTHFNIHPDSVSEIRSANPELEAAIQSFEDQYTSLCETIESVQSVLGLPDLIDSIESGNEDVCAVGICDDESDKDSVWKLFTCSSEGKGFQDTNRSILFQNGSIALVEVERWYDGWYSVGYVVGVDDGDTPFFIHRIRDADVLDETDEWTTEKLHNIMGFDANYESDTIEFGTRYRIQGDVYLERRNLSDEVDSAIDLYSRNVVNEQASEFAEEFIQIQELTEYFTARTRIINRLNPSNLRNVLQWNEEYDTETLKQIQDMVNLSEEQVRTEQDNREWQRLSQNRRREIIQYLLEERLYQWIEQTKNVSMTQTRTEAKAEQHAQYMNTEPSCPITLGNHLINIRNATIHPDSNRQQEEDIEVVVPEETQLYVLHDEHNSKILTVPEGIYTFGFLDQHFNT